jgi:hypothetical protein
MKKIPIILTVSFSFVFGLSLFLFFFGFYEGNNFFNWGTPIIFFNHKITSNTTFYLLQFIMFVHQLINNAVNSIVYPWIINSIQDHKNKNLEFSKVSCILIINFFDLYSQIDMILILSGFMSQISFFITITIANIITGTIINLGYINAKKRDLITDKTYLLNIV